MRRKPIFFHLTYIGNKIEIYFVTGSLWIASREFGLIAILVEVFGSRRNAANEKPSQKLCQRVFKYDFSRYVCMWRDWFKNCYANCKKRLIKKIWMAWEKPNHARINTYTDYKYRKKCWFKIEIDSFFLIKFNFNGHDYSVWCTHHESNADVFSIFMNNFQRKMEINGVWGILHSSISVCSNSLLTNHFYGQNYFSQRNSMCMSFLFSFSHFQSWNANLFWQQTWDSRKEEEKISQKMTMTTRTTTIVKMVQTMTTATWTAATTTADHS